MTEYEFGPFTRDLSKSGTEFLQAVCDTAKREYGANYAFVGTLRIAESERMYVQAFHLDVADAKPNFYDICVAPCQQVIREQSTVVHLDNLQSHFPNSPGIKRFRMQSYVGCPLVDENGASVGIFVLEWQQPITQRKAEEVRASMEAILPRVSSEVCGLIRLHALNVLMNPVANSSSNEAAVFRAAIRNVAALAQVKTAFIARCTDDEQSRFRVLAAVVDDKVQERAEGQVLNFEDTPCGYLRDHDTYFIERDLQELYPDSKDYAALDLHSYYGVVIRDRNGAPIGHVALFHDRPMSDRVPNSRLLGAALERARNELEHYIAEQESKSLKEALNVRKKLQSLGLMAGTIAHDFNNLLTSIIGHTELAMLDLNPRHPSAKSLRIAEENMWRARDVIGDLMDFAGNTAKTHAKPVNLNETVNRALDLLRPRLSVNCRTVLDLDSRLPPIVGQPSQLEQIIVNVALNSIDALDATGGVLTVRTALLKGPIGEAAKCLTGHGATMEMPCVMLEISDNGPGMPPETAERVFDPFFSTKDDSRGLGLAGVLGIARRMGAGLTLNSKEGQGTTLRMYMEPVRDKKPELDGVPPASNKAEEAVNRGTILIVDDEPEVLGIVSMQVSKLGYETVPATCGEEALELARSTPDLRAAVIDVMMPGIDGWETLRQLRTQFGQMPAIMMSGYNQSEPTVPLDGSDPVEVLTKPFPFDVLKAGLQTITKGASVYGAE